ncbi:MAG: patatin-like phospholipase family protein [Cyclobacteriaceae bacterium]|nr:patatin-like phospholipase family protein [Cyclobacteriaceae bacterium]MCH8515187.1 patatin-like phospholipase family protein [Cyclobacteriaceae bacterium]
MMKVFFQKLYYSLPFQLLIFQVRNNQSLLLIWFILFAFVSGWVGRVFGVHFLFLDPEYVGKVNFTSFYIVGLTLGGFIMAYHISCYILDSERFSFLGLLRLPFTRFCFNNSLIPLTFLVYYIYKIFNFQFLYEYDSHQSTFILALGLLLGVLTSQLLLFIYFWVTNKNYVLLLSDQLDKRLKKVTIYRVNVMKKIDAAKRKETRVDYFLDWNFRLIPVIDNPNKYDRQAISKVFDQNHFNSVLIQLFIFVLIFVLGIFRELEIFQLPAAASGLLFFTIILMLAGAFSYWFRSWATTIAIVLFLALNVMVKENVLTRSFLAFGMDYSEEPVPFRALFATNSANAKGIDEDVSLGLDVLDNWKEKTKKSKPLMIINCMSGGGQRSALWALRSFQKLDSLSMGKFSRHTALITGASGGMVGAAFYRELLLRKSLGDTLDIYDAQYLDQIARDNLNPVLFTLLVNDLFLNFQKFEFAGRKYYKDRGYAFEEQLNKNLGGIMDRKLAEYRDYEMSATIPMMLLSPVIINNGKRLFISPLSVSYMGRLEAIDEATSKRGIDFRRSFKHHDPDSLRFLTALRMSATFPYITPNISLPTFPPADVIDAGLADNYGIDDAIHFIHTFRDWINENTAGVLLLSVRDSEREEKSNEKEKRSLVDRFVTPLSSIYSNWANFQDISNAQALGKIKESMDVDIDLIELTYSPKLLARKIDEEGEKLIGRDNFQPDRASLNWRLTSREKVSIINTADSPENVKKINQILTKLQD